MIDRIDSDVPRAPGPCCHACGDYLGRCESGDVTMCTKCGQWHATGPYTPEHDTFAIDADQAAGLALERIDPYELLAAMERNAERMICYAP